MQVPAQVEYEKATSVGHALSLLVRYGPDARVLAGGHSLIPMMKLRLAQPEVLIDINGLADLRYMRLSPSGATPCRPPAKGGRPPFHPPPQGNEHRPLAPGPPACRAGE